MTHAKLNDWFDNVVERHEVDGETVLEAIADGNEDRVYDDSNTFADMMNDMDKDCDFETEADVEKYLLENDYISTDDE